MEKRQLGRTNIRITPITLGGWAFGKTQWAGVSDEESIETIRTALDKGISMIDTAIGYDCSEEIIGKAIKGRRDEVILSSKCTAPPQVIKERVETCLRRLGTDYIDLYQTHYPHPETPLAEQLGVLSELRKEGKIRAVGVSNCSLKEMEEGLKAVRYDTCQPPYNIFWRQAETEGIIDFCRKNEISILPYSPLAQGLLTGKYRKRADIPQDIRSKSKLFSAGTFEKCIQVVEYLEEIAEKHGKTMAQAAINWVIHRPGVTSAIVGAKRVSQLLDNMGAIGWQLNREEIEELSQRGMEISETLDFETNMWGWSPKQ